MARTTTDPKQGAAVVGRRRRSPRVGRVVRAAVVLAVLGTAGARAMASPLGPTDASGRGATAISAHLGYGIDNQGRLDRVTVQRDAAAPDQEATLELTGTGGHTLAAVTTVLHGTEAVVTLPAPVDPELVTGAALRPAGGPR